MTSLLSNSLLIAYVSVPLLSKKLLKTHERTINSQWVGGLLFDKYKFSASFWSLRGNIFEQQRLNKWTLIL